MSIKAHLQQPSEIAGTLRQSERFYLYLATSGELADGKPANVEIHNISTGGLLLETSVELQQGAQIEVELPNIGLTAAVVTWKGEGVYGCAFPEPIDAAALSAARLKSEAALPPIPAGRHQTGDLAVLGKKLEQTRKERRLTLAQVAERLGVSKPTVWAWEKGKARPLEERFPAIAEALGVNVEELYSAQPSGSWADVIAASRADIADALGVRKDQVRIMLDL